VSRAANGENKETERRKKMETFKDDVRKRRAKKPIEVRSKRKRTITESRLR
jgi:hypothetical protein